uniref:Transmembrane protein n=1 Tax=Peronospora matthiolae TaxID=2874970 RepID=A0AAV1V3K6_9STRA
MGVTKKELPLLQHNGYTATSPTASSVSSSYSRVASEELIVPAPDSVNSVYYGVDAFSPTLVDFYTVDQKRIVWSSRAHRKIMTTLYRAWHGKHWKVYSLSFWGGLCAMVAFLFFLAGAAGEAVAFSASDSGDAITTQTLERQVHSSVDLPLLLAAVFFLAYHAITYLEVINCCHNLEIWLEEYFHGTEPVLERQYVGFFPSRIDFWTTILGMFGSMLYVFARAYVWVKGDMENFGIVNVKRDDLSLIVGYWVPFFAGSFLLLLSAYLAHVEVVHQWFSCRLTTLETWITGLNMLAMVGFFLSSTLQFMDPFSALFSFQACVMPFASGCVLGLASSVLSLMELEKIHKRHKHPEYGLYACPAGYGTAASYGSFKQQQQQV